MQAAGRNSGRKSDCADGGGWSSPKWRFLALTIILLCLAEWFEMLDNQLVSSVMNVVPVQSSSNSSNLASKVDTQILDESRDHSGTPRPPPSPPHPHGKLLLEALRQTRSLVTNGRLERISEKERAEWNSKNPCSCRTELQTMYDDRRHSKQLPKDPDWEQVLDEYSELHRACTKRVGNISDYFLQRKDSVAGCKFVIADANPGAGLGNKILVLSSAFTYALATQRVLLVGQSNLLTSYTCEPFVGSSWFLNSSQVLLTRSPNNTWQTDDDFYREINSHVGYFKQNASAQLTATAAAAVKEKYQSPNVTFPWRPRDYAVVASPDSAHMYQAHPRFYCQTEQMYYSHVPFVLWSGCIHTIPRLFTTLRFMPLFEDLFPDRMILTRILRSIVLPDDVLWSRVKHLAHAYLFRRDGARRVGIQMRFRSGGKEEWMVNRRVVDCLWKEGILPNVSQPRPTQLNESLSDIKNAPVIKVFIASLLHGLYEHITKIYLDNPATVTGEDVSLVQLTSSQKQRWNSLEEDTEAFTEIFLLSFSDQLLVTPMSTFGGIAQAYGALVPWFIEYRSEVGNGTVREVCKRGETVDVAQQGQNVGFSCGLDPVKGGNLTERAPYLRPVLDIELSQKYVGIHLVTDF